MTLENDETIAALQDECLCLLRTEFRVAADLDQIARILRVLAFYTRVDNLLTRALKIGLVNKNALTRNGGWVADPVFTSNDFKVFLTEDGVWPLKHNIGWFQKYSGGIYGQNISPIFLESSYRKSREAKHYLKPDNYVEMCRSAVGHILNRIRDEKMLQNPSASIES